MSIKKPTIVAAAIAILAAAVFSLVILRMRCGGKGNSEVEIATPHREIAIRPGASYAPTTTPLRRASPPALVPKRLSTALAALRESGEGEDGEDIEDSAADDDVIDIAEPISPDDPGMAAFNRERNFAEDLWTALADTNNVVQNALSLLSAQAPEDRAFGGALLALSSALDDETLAIILFDEDPSVPLTVLDWIRDFGEENDAVNIKNMLSQREIPREDFLKYANESGGAFGGGRSALDLWLEDFDAANSLDVAALAELAISSTASYDVREQALFKLLEPETRANALPLLESFRTGFGDGDSTLANQTARKMTDLAEISNPDGDEEKVWDSEAPVVFFLASSEEGLPARDLANYLEYALRRDDQEYPPIIEEGTWEFANDFIERMQPQIETLLPEEQEALDRIAVQLDRLVEYDPAFNPFETVEDDGEDEEGEGEGEEEEEEEGEGEGEEEGEEEDEGEGEEEDDEAVAEQKRK